MTTKQTTMRNRYLQDIVFTKTGEDEITVTGDFGTFYRVSCDPDSGEVKMFDPQGGPLMSVGVSINHLTNIADNRLVKKIEILEDKVILRF